MNGMATNRVSDRHASRGGAGAERMIELTGSDRVSLRHYIETLMSEYRQAHAREHELLAEGVEHAREAIDIRLQSMNEFRAQINSERGCMLTKDKFDALHESLVRRVDATEQTVANLKGRMAAYAAALGIGLIVLQLILTFVVKQE